MAYTENYDNFYFHKYPDKLDLSPESELHQFIVGKLLRYGRESARIISKRYPAWNEMDEKLTGFIQVSEAEKRVKEKDKRKPISIVFPYSYAILETLVSYLVAAFFPEPMFRYEGVGPEDIGGATLLEKLISMQVNRSKCALNLHTMFRDASAYGFGVVSPQWITKMGKRIVKKPIGYADSEGNIVPMGTERVVEDAILYEGNALINIDPYRYLPDPSVPIHEPQRGEFVGWLDRTNYLDLLSEERNDEEMFNVRYLSHVNNKVSSILSPEGTSISRSRRNSRNLDATVDRQTVDPIDQLHMYVKLIPRQWKLGSSQYPEKWLFTLASDSVIIKAKPLNLHHDMFPVAICAPDFDGYSPVTYSRLEIVSGMQTVIDWLFNAHIANVRKAINDVLIVDPYLVNIEDLKDPDAGGLVRLRRPAWGRGVDNAVKQLSIVDITARNMQDVSLTINYMQQIMGTDNPTMGNLRQGGPERLTSAEYQGTARGAVSRLERVAKIVGIQAFQDIGYMFAYHSQQLMSQEVYLRSIGEWPQTITQQFQLKGDRVLVSPDDILISYDVIVRDGSIPGGNFSGAWLQLYDILSKNPVLMQQFDMVRIFEYIATSLGAKNVETFKVPQQPQQAQLGTAPDEQIQNNVQVGNLIPMRGGLGG